MRRDRRAPEQAANLAPSFLRNRIGARMGTWVISDRAGSGVHQWIVTSGQSALHLWPAVVHRVCLLAI